MFINGFDILWDEIDDYVADIQSIRSEYSTHSEPLCPPLRATCSIV